MGLTYNFRGSDQTECTRPTSSDTKKTTSEIVVGISLVIINYIKFNIYKARLVVQRSLVHYQFLVKNREGAF